MPRSRTTGSTASRGTRPRATSVSSAPLPTMSGPRRIPLPRAANPLPAGQTVATLDALFARASPGGAVALAAVDGPAFISAANACAPSARSTRIRSAATTASRSTSACAPGAPASAICSPATCSSATTATRRSARGNPRTLASRADEGARQALSIVPSRSRRTSSSASPERAFARRVDLLRLAESQKRIVVFVSHPWGGGIRRYMNDLVALTEARCEVLFLEPAVGDTVKLSWPRAGESFALYFTLPGDLRDARRNAAHDRRRAPALPPRPPAAALDPRTAVGGRRSRTTTRCTTIIRSARNTTS